MFFEGSEKKLEIFVSAATDSLRLLNDDFWANIVTCAQAEILSKTSNSYCDAYLLSESSLLVWDDHFLMITCGSTTLIDAALAFIEAMGSAAITYASYQRKSEFNAYLQTSRFEDDINRLAPYLIGEAYRVGQLDGHHHYIFCSEQHVDYIPQKRSAELLMYHIEGEAAQYLRSLNQDVYQIRSLLRLDQLFADFIFDDHAFTPCGYSINGLCGREYFLMHITPQEQSSYVSIETNIKSDQLINHIFTMLITILRPRSWDTIGNDLLMDLSYLPAYHQISHCELLSPASERICFNQYLHSSIKIHVATRL